MSTRNGIGTTVRMRLMTTLISLIFMFFVAPAVAGTTTLSSTFLLAPSTTGVTCNFVNVSSKTLNVTVSVLDVNATVISTGTFVAAPQKGVALSPSFADTADVDLRCVFAFSGSSKSLRAALEVLDATTDVPLVILPAT